MILDIRKSRILAINNALFLNFWQRWACRLLKIVPEQKGNYTIEVETKQVHTLTPRSGVVDEAGRVWLVTETPSFNKVILRNTVPMHLTSQLTGKMAVTYLHKEPTRTLHVSK